MPDVHVTRHGERWSVRERPDGDAISEYATRSEAESAARVLLGDRGGEGDVVVHEEDATGLAGAQDPEAGEPAATPADRDNVQGGAPERLRENQGGL